MRSTELLHQAIADDRQFLAELRCRASSQFDVLGGRESIAVRIDARLRVRRERYRQAGRRASASIRCRVVPMRYESHADRCRNLDASTDRGNSWQKRCSSNAETVLLSS